MKNVMYSRFIFIVSLILVCASASAQELSSRSLLFRGRVASSYPYIKYTGIYYAYSPEYKEGIVKYNHKLYKGVYLNYNAHKDEMCVDNGQGMQKIALNKKFFEYCVFDNMKFVYLSGIEKMDDRYYQVLFECEDAVLYKKIYKHYEARDVNKEFLERVSYYLYKDGEYTQIRNAQHLLKIYPEHKKMRYKEQGSVDGDLVVILDKIYNGEGGR